MAKMTMDETSKKDLLRYFNQTIWCFLFLCLTIVVGICLATYLDHRALATHLWGSLAGAALAIINVLAIGYAFYSIGIRKSRRWVMVVPIASFVAMAAVAYLLANIWPTYLVGFAFGLGSPVLFGLFLTFLSKPA
jgi:hypothetical protein